MAELHDSMEPARGIPWKRALPWATYDWANSAFAATVMAAFVPFFNQTYWSVGVQETVSSFRLSVAISAAFFVVAAMAPVLGAIADRGGTRKKFLLFFAAQGVAATIALFFVGRGQWAAGLTLYGLGLIGFAGANIFYDSMLISVAGETGLDIVSALGYALGYVGGGLLLALNVYMVLHPAAFGLAGAEEAVRWAFLTVGIWWALFTLPLLWMVPEFRPLTLPQSIRGTIRTGLGELGRTMREIRRLRSVMLFLIGYWLYIDGVDTVIQMAVDYGTALGFGLRDLILALLITQFVGFPAALLFGKAGEKIGPKSGIMIGLAVYVGVCFWGWRMQSPREFYILAVAVGLVQGGVQSLSRSLYARLIPSEKSGEFFGFYNMLGKFAAILGPLLMGITGRLTGDSRVSILALILLFAAGAAFLTRVRTGEVLLAAASRRAAAREAGL